MSDEFEWTWKNVAKASYKVLSYHSPAGAKEKNEE